MTRKKIIKRKQKRSRKVDFLSLVILVLLILNAYIVFFKTSTDCGNDFKYSLTVPKDFNFEFKISDNEKEYLYNSYNQKLFKAIYFNKIDSLNLKLNQTDKQLIWQKLTSINLLDYSEDYIAGNIIKIPEPDFFNVNINFNGITKKIKFKNHLMVSKNKKTDELYVFFHLIDSIIINKPEFEKSKKMEFLIE
jgi:hypothetical protein